MKHLLISLVLLVSSQFAFGQVSPIQLGRASDIWTITQPSQNQIYADNQTNTILFIHQHDVTIYGGGQTETGKLRYDISTDGGTTFTTDIGTLNPTYTDYGRHPQITGFNPNNSSNPFDTKYVFWATGAKPPIGDFLSYVAGVGDVVASGFPNNTEEYLFHAELSHRAGGLCQGADGEFWVAEANYDGVSFTGDISIIKGIYDDLQQEINWSVLTTLTPNHNGGSPQILEPNIAFSPDGSTGWMAFGGDVTGSTDGVHTPIFYRSSDGGDTWIGPFFINFNAEMWITDRLDPLTGSGTYGMVQSFDLTVDANGNPHLLTVVAENSNYTPVDFEYTKLLVDVTTADLGASWETRYIAPVLNISGDFGQEDINTGEFFSMDNFCQISRSDNGNIIFYSWVDSETDDGEGGFEYTGLLSPNLRASAYRITDNNRTCVKKITDGDLIWDGRALCPTVAPTVIENNGIYKVPTVSVEMIVNDQWQPCNFWYFGNEVVFEDDDFRDFSSYDPDDYLGSEDGACSVALPIALLDFNASPTEQSIDLEWTNRESIAASFFEIEKREAGFSDFKRIGSIHITPDNAQQKKYQFSDVEVTKGVVYYYRLKWQTTDGQIYYSTIESAQLKEDATISIYPNPTKGVLFITSHTPRITKLEVSILDINGRQVHQQNFPITSTPNYYLNLDLPKGLYWVKIIGKGMVEIKRLVIQ